MAVLLNGTIEGYPQVCFAEGETVLQVEWQGNVMNCLWKVLMSCVIILMLFAMTGSIAMAQVGFGFPMLWRFPSFSDQPNKEKTLEIPRMTERDILVEDFESWEKKYPSGYGIGYATIFQKTVLDTQQGSRVLDVNRPVSQFLVGSAYEKHRLLFDLSTPSGANGPEGADGISMETHGIFAFDFRAPSGTDPFDNFELGISCEGCGKTVYVRLLPFCGAWDTNTPSDTHRVNLHETILNPAGELQVTVNLNSDLHDGSWHTVLIDLKDAVHSVFIDEGLDPNDWCLERATNVYVTGGIFRLDNLVFKYKPTREFFEYFDLFEMGPLYTRIFEPYRYLFIADYKGADITACDMRGDLKTYDSIAGLMLNPDNFILARDPNDPNDPVVKYWTDLGADPDLFGGDDLNMATLFGRDSFRVDLGLPIFADPKLRFGGSVAQKIIDAGILVWNATIKGYTGNNMQGFHLAPLPLNPYDGMPTYLPAQHAALDAIEALGKPYYRPGFVYLLEGALWNAGVTVWPNIAALDLTPENFEDLVVTIEVSNGVDTDTRTFPVIVVNYPVDNYPPVLQNDIPDQVFYTRQKNRYIVNFIDPDCFIFSMSPGPLTSHMPGFPISDTCRTDMDSFKWGIRINGLNPYDYGPWFGQFTSPFTGGLIVWTPKFEGAYFYEVFCADDRDAMSMAGFNIFCVNQGTWLNHSPVILSKPAEPVVMKAGEEFILHTPHMAVEDPDGDEIYASCNIGSCGRAPDGSFIWKFQSNFPGSYLVEIVFYDVRGGYAVMEFPLEVNPWWTY